MKKQRPITLSGVIRKRLPIIETRMYEGVRQAVIVDELNAEGFNVSIKDFRQLLYRARKSQKPQSYESKTITEIAIEPKPSEEKASEKTNTSVKKMSQKDIHEMLKNDIDLDSY